MLSTRRLAISVAFFLLVPPARMLAQELPPLPPPPDVAGPMEYFAAPGGDMGFKVMAFEGMPGGKVITGAPFTAQAVTETTRVLSDGNRINRKTTTMLYRDSQGRTRRETTVDSIGPWSAQGEPSTFISISDPVAGVNYMLNPQDHTANELPRMEGKHGKFSLSYGPRTSDGMFIARQAIRAGATGNEAKAGVERVKEDLGQQVIQGVAAQGTRETVTIATGAIGNEKPITVTSERWYSPDLQILVMSKRDDPRFGQTTYTLTSINRTEPAPNLFQVPPDYTVTQGKPFQLSGSVPPPPK